jgi:hypothetical protein
MRYLTDPEIWVGLFLKFSVPRRNMVRVLLDQESYLSSNFKMLLGSSPDSKSLRLDCKSGLLDQQYIL